MPRSSENVAALAAALAKAQVELTNPDKSLVAAIPAERGQPARSFRYASLAGGLDIVRKTLGRHEIATIQSTAIDRDSGTIKLTTTLAHASGEWIASDWPVCALTDLPTPHRMGAALTYARRYGLFTMVGITGEDDLDAPDLPLQAGPTAQMPSPPLAPSASSASPQWKNSKRPPTKPVVTLDLAASASHRDTLLAELASIPSFDSAALWAKRIIPIKNTLVTEHARAVEAALEIELAKFEEPVEAANNKAANPSLDSGPAQHENETEYLATADRSALKFGHTPRRRNKAHLKFVASQPCLLCGRQPSDPHHLRFAQPQALGRKVSDEFVVPLCRTHHREVHRIGREAGWWKAVKPEIDPLEIARRLWEQSRDGQPTVQTALSWSDQYPPMK
jgi:hypothetical protein